MDQKYLPTELKEKDYPNLTFENRLSYVTQLLISSSNLRAELIL